MKKLSLLLIVLFSLGSTLFAQDQFFKVLDLDTTSEVVYPINLLIDNDTIVFYSLFFEGETVVGMYFVKMDTLGNVLNIKYHTSDSTALTTGDVGRIIKTNDNGYAILGTYFKLPPTPATYKKNQYLLKVKNDLSLDFLKYYSFPEALGTINSGLIEHHSGYYLFGRKKLEDNAGIDWFVIYTDTLGNEIWRKSYGKTNSSDRGKDLFLLDSNTIIMFGQTRDIIPSGQPNNINHFRYPIMLGIDTLGIPKWNWNWIGQKAEDEIGEAVIATPDGGFIYAGSVVTIDENEGFHSKHHVAKIDSTGNIAWHHLIDPRFAYGGPAAITLASDGHYIVSGSLGMYIRHYKVSIDGDSIWTRLDSTWVGDWDEPGKGRVIATQILPSGSIISLGEMMKETPNGWVPWSFIMKLNPDGCLDTLGCWPVGVADLQKKGDNKLVVYPNPASEVVHFTFSKVGTFPRKGEIIITDILGHLIHQIEYQGEDLSWNLSEVKRGVYFYRMEVEGVILDVGRLVVR